MVWKIVQLAVFLVLTVLIFEIQTEDMKHYSHALLACAIIALGLTVLIFTPIMYLLMWLHRWRTGEKLHVVPPPSAFRHLRRKND